MKMLKRLFHPGEPDAAVDTTARPPRMTGGPITAGRPVIIGDIPASNPAPGLYAYVSGGRPLPSFAELRARYPEPEPEVDFRAMLKNDDQAWSTKTRLEAILGRPYLATRLVDQLDPETSATLADRLDSLIRDAVADAMAKTAHDVDVAVTLKVEEMRRTQVERAREVSRERFGRPSRLD